MSTDLQEPPGKEVEPKKPSRQILEHEIVEGADALDRPAIALFISGLSAGLDIGFSLFLMAVVWTLADATFSAATARLLVANMYAIGFIFVVLGRSELFTEQTTLAVLPVLNRQGTPFALARLWIVVYVANILGAAASAMLTIQIGPALGVIDPRAFGDLARALTDHPAPVIFGARGARRLADGFDVVAGGRQPRHHQPGGAGLAYRDGHRLGPLAPRGRRLCRSARRPVCRNWNHGGGLRPLLALVHARQRRGRFFFRRPHQVQLRDQRKTTSIVRRPVSGRAG